MKKIMIFILLVSSFFFFSQTVLASEMKNKNIIDFVQVLDDNNETSNETNENNTSSGGTTGGATSGGGANCGTLGELQTWINNAFKFVQYAGVALAVILTGVDFIQVIGGSKDDDLTKAFNRAIKRLVAVVLLLLTTVLVNFIVDVVMTPIMEAEVPNCVGK